MKCGSLITDDRHQKLLNMILTSSFRPSESDVAALGSAEYSLKILRRSAVTVCASKTMDMTVKAVVNCIVALVW